MAMDTSAADVTSERVTPSLFKRDFPVIGLVVGVVVTMLTVNLSVLWVAGPAIATVGAVVAARRWSQPVGQRRWFTVVVALGAISLWWFAGAVWPVSAEIV